MSNNKRATYTIITILILVILGVGVCAVTNEVPDPGHSLAELQSCSDGETLISNSGTWNCSLFSSLESDPTQEAKTKVVEIGGWNMNTEQVKLVEHKISDFTKIVSVTGIIFIDGKQYGYTLGDLSDRAESDTRATINVINSKTINLQAGNYPHSSAGFDDASFNRGYLYISYLE